MAHREQQDDKDNGTSLGEGQATLIGAASTAKRRMRSLWQEVEGLTGRQLSGLTRKTAQGGLRQATGNSMNVRTIKILAGEKAVTLSGAHPPYLDGIEAARQWGNTPLMRLVKAIPEGGIYLDVGANIGLTAVTAAVMRPDIQVVAFEPVPSNARLLDHNIAANDIKNCRTVHCAVGAAPGSVSMSDNGPWSVVEANGGGAVTTTVTTLDVYCAEHLPARRVDLVKIDVEGHEPQVLEGGHEVIERWRFPILMEFNSWALVLAGHQPLAFARDLCGAFDVTTDEGEQLSDPIALVHDNMVKRGCVQDVILRPQGTYDDTRDLPPAAKMLRSYHRLRGQARYLFRGHRPSR